MLTLFKNAQLYNPDYAGKKDLLTGGKTILAIGDYIDPPGGVEVNIIDCEGLMLVPGLIDSHVHKPLIQRLEKLFGLGLFALINQLFGEFVHQIFIIKNPVSCRGQGL